MARDAYKPVWVIAFVAAGVLAVVGLSRGFGGNEIVPWRDDPAAGRAEAAAGGKPVLLYFTAEWCGPCHAMKRTTWADATVEGALRPYVPIRVDVDRHPDTAAAYGVSSIPMMAVLDAGGNVVKSTSGRMSAEEFVEWLGEPAKAAATTMSTASIGQSPAQSGPAPTVARRAPDMRPASRQPVAGSVYPTNIPAAVGRRK